MPDFLDPITYRNTYEYRRTNGYEFKRWRGALAAALAGTGIARIWIVGDSMLESYGQTSVANRIPEKLRTSIQQVYRPGGRGYVPSHQSATVGNSEVTLANAPDQTDYGWGIGRFTTFGTAANQTATYTFFGDRIYVMYTQGNGAGGMKVTLDGVVKPVQGTNNATLKSGRVWDSGALTLGTHTIIVQPDNSLGAPNNILSLILDGFMVFASDFSAGVHIINSSHASLRAEAFNGAAGNLNWADAMDTMPPDLMLIEFGLNEQYAATVPVSIATFQTNLNAIVTRAIAAGAPSNVSVVLIPLWAPSYTKAGGAFNCTNVSGQNTLTRCGGQPVAADVGKVISGTTGGTVPGGTTITAVTPYDPVADTGGTITMSNVSTGAITTFTITSRTAAFTDAEWLPWRQAMYDLAVVNSWAIWDMYNLFQFVGTDPQGLTFDSLHASDKGAAIIAQELSTLLTGLPGPVPFLNKGDMNAKGDILVGTADNAYTNLQQGTVGDGATLTKDSSQTTGVKWDSAPSRNTVTQTIGSSTLVDVTGLSFPIIAAGTSYNFEANLNVNAGTTTGATAVGVAVNCPAGATLNAAIIGGTNATAIRNTFFTQVNTAQNSFVTVNAVTCPIRIFGVVTAGTATSHTGTVQVRLQAVGTATSVNATATIQNGAYIRAVRIA